MNCILNKSKIRTELIKLRNSISEEKKEIADIKIINKLYLWLDKNKPKVLGGYIPIKNEPNLFPLYKKLPTLNIVLALPLVKKKHFPFSYIKWNIGEKLIPDKTGIPAPIYNKENLIKTNVILVPCVGFDTENFRIGYGGGYFDRTLSLKPKPVTIGISYSFLKTQFIVDKHDVPLDLIITD